MKQSASAAAAVLLTLSFFHSASADEYVCKKITEIQERTMLAEDARRLSEQEKLRESYAVRIDKSLGKSIAAMREYVEYLSKEKKDKLVEYDRVSGKIDLKKLDPAAYETFDAQIRVPLNRIREKRELGGLECLNGAKAGNIVQIVNQFNGTRDGGLLRIKNLEEGNFPAFQELKADPRFARDLPFMSYHCKEGKGLKWGMNHAVTRFDSLEIDLGEDSEPSVVSCSYQRPHGKMYLSDSDLADLKQEDPEIAKYFAPELAWGQACLRVPITSDGKDIVFKTKEFAGRVAAAVSRAQRGREIAQLSQKYDKERENAGCNPDADLPAAAVSTEEIKPADEIKLSAEEEDLIEMGSEPDDASGASPAK